MGNKKNKKKNELVDDLSLKTSRENFGNLTKKERKKLYEKELEKLQVELLKFQYYVKEKKLKILIILEGRDAAGKGGTIKRITEHLNPRGCRVVALPAPSDVEKTQWFFQRYVANLPSGGEIAVFDRSWYNRAMVEPVMGFCTPEEHRQFLRDVPDFERLLTNSGIKIFKFYLSISKATQKKRFDDRERNPLKTYKISDVDKKSQELWDKYTIAQYHMLMSTDNLVAPWIVIDSNDKKSARINVIKSILANIDYEDKADKSTFVYNDPNSVLTAQQELKHMQDVIDNINLKL